MDVSVLILTLDEETNLDECLDTVAWCSDIHVLDSFSADRTVEIAESRGARVAQREFDSFAGQQNWAVQNLPFLSPWILYIDADERVTPELRDSILPAAAGPGGNVAFRLRKAGFFMGTWLKHVQASPYYIRLFRRDKMR